MLSETLDKVAGVGRKPLVRKIKAPKQIQRVEMHNEGPFGRPSATTAMAARGLAYERKFGRALSKMLTRDEFLRSGVWLRYVADRRGGWAQMDHLLLTEAATVVFECKLTHTKTALAQLSLLYGPLVSWLIRPRRLVLVEVCKNLSPGYDSMYSASGLDELLHDVPAGEPVMFHWAGGPVRRGD